jgi:phosphatidylglycerol:prolipoprotein diacylglycerol transferase
VQITLDPVAFYIGSFAVRWYNIILVSALIAGYFVLRAENRRMGLPRIHTIRLYLWSLVFTAIFAKLFFYIDRWNLYAADPADMLNLALGRLDGAIIGFLILLIIYARATGYRFWFLGDAVTLDMAVVIALGRWGCFFNGCCYGLPCDLPWAVIYTNPHSRAPLDLPLHPVQLYQVAWYSLIFISLWLMRKRLKPEGSLLLLFLIMHVAGDYATRLFRDDHELLFGLQQAQLISILMLLAAVPLYIVRLVRSGRHEAVMGSDT